MIAATPADNAWTFGWERREVISLIEPLIEARQLRRTFIPELETEAVMYGRLGSRR